MVNIVQNGNGIGIVSEFTLSVIQNQLKTVPILPEIEIEIGVEALSMDDLTPVACEFVKIIRRSMEAVLQADKSDQIRLIP